MFIGGEDEGLKRLHEYLESGALSHYMETKVQLYGKDHSSKLSAWLSNGCLSPRMVYLKVKKWGETHNQVLLAQLYNDHMLIKDYQIYQAHCIQEEKVLGYGGMFDNTTRKWDVDPEQEQAYLKGQTGIPFVDACLQEAIQTGYLSNRGRQVIAGYLSIEMNLDWRVGFKFFQRNFIDFHIEQCALSWQNVVGFFKERFSQVSLIQFDLERKHNNKNILSLQQSKQYDPKGVYIQTMLPELGKFPVEYIHEPWTMIKLSRSYIFYLQKVYVVNKLQLRTFLKNRKKQTSNFDIEIEKAKYKKKKIGSPNIALSESSNDYSI